MEPTAEEKSSISVEPCTLALQPFSALDVAECCPLYARLTKAEAVNNATEDDLLNLQRELELLVQSTTYRIKKLTEEYQKADAFVKQYKETSSSSNGISDDSKANSAALNSATGNQSLQQPSTIILKIKADNLGSVASETSSVDKKIKRKRESISNVKRRRPGEQSESDYEKSIASKNRESIRSVSPDSEFLKKKKQKRDDIKAMSHEPSETPAPSGVGGEGDSKIKPTQQIPINTFWNYVDSFFKDVTEDDLSILDDNNNENPECFFIPPLGKHYNERWKEEDQYLKTGTSPDSKKNNSANFLDDSGISSDQYCGKFTERILSALMELELHESDENEYLDDDTEANSDNIKMKIREPSKDEMYSIEERLKKELKYLGLLDDDPSVDTESDEIVAELQRLQEEYRAISAVNFERKSIVREKAIDLLAYQEYRLVLEELDKQVEQAFYKRQRYMSKKKRKIPGSAPDGISSLLERRQKLQEEFNPIFPPELVSIPSESIFADDAAVWFKEVSLVPPPPPPLSVTASVMPSPAITEQPIIAATSSAPPPIESTSQKKPVTEPKPRKRYPKKPKAEKQPAPTDGSSAEPSVPPPPRKRAPKKDRKKKEDADNSTEQKPIAGDSSTQIATDDAESMVSGSILPDWMMPV